MQRKSIGGNVSARALLVAIALVALAALILPRALTGSDPESVAAISLPTDNDGLYHDDDSLFYMETAVSRDEPWAAGKFGFVRNPRRTSAGSIFLRHHAGVDIRPLYRDRNGEPLDTVRSIADGVVVYVNDTAGHSNYGRYIVVEHRWGGSPYYSLYAHLARTWADSGARVRRGDPIARIGYTGAGINRRRAHLHLELALLVSEGFDRWYDRYYKREPNRHGIYSGLNLVSVDVAEFLLRVRDDADFAVADLVAREAPFFTVTVPMSDTVDMLARYPWLLTAPAAPGDRSWRISFARHGLPVRVEPVETVVTAPTLDVLDRSDMPYSWLTKSMVTGSGDHARLTESGRRWIELLTTAQNTW